MNAEQNHLDDVCGVLCHMIVGLCKPLIPKRGAALRRKCSRRTHTQQRGTGTRSVLAFSAPPRSLSRQARFALMIENGSVQQGVFEYEYRFTEYEDEDERGGLMVGGGRIAEFGLPLQGRCA